jgi:hypothetical protein
VHGQTAAAGLTEDPRQKLRVDKFGQGDVGHQLTGRAGCRGPKKAGYVARPGLGIDARGRNHLPQIGGERLVRFAARLAVHDLRRKCQHACGDGQIEDRFDERDRARAQTP